MATHFVRKSGTKMLKIGVFF